jgi:hypothetical protein
MDVPKSILILVIEDLFNPIISSKGIRTVVITDFDRPTIIASLVT